jgi:hypothetical protein
MPSNSRRESEAIVATFLIHPECPFELSLKPIQASKKKPGRIRRSSEKPTGKL